MKKFMQYFAAAALIISFLPAISGAIGSGAHIYVTENVFGSNDADLFYGSIAPDLSLYVPDAGSWVSGFEDTHYNYIQNSLLPKTPEEREQHIIWRLSSVF